MHTFVRDVCGGQRHALLPPVGQVSLACIDVLALAIIYIGDHLYWRCITRVGAITTAMEITW
jgi:hypothetical protein